MGCEVTVTLLCLKEFNQFILETKWIFVTSFTFQYQVQEKGSYVATAFAGAEA